MPKLFADSDKAVTAQAIRDLYRQLGVIPTRVLAKAVIDRKVLTDDELGRITLRGVIELCRQALSRKTVEGVPFAQPISGGRNAPWQQLVLFIYDEFAQLLDRRAQGISDDCAEWWRLYTWGTQRYTTPFYVPPFMQRWHDDLHVDTLNDEGDVESPDNPDVEGDD